MPVHEIGPQIQTLTGINVRAKDHAGKYVTVSASHEAIADCGWPSIWSAASSMYDAGEYETIKSVPVIRVTTGNCR